jgi:hypothetical protein
LGRRPNCGILRIVREMSSSNLGSRSFLVRKCTSLFGLLLCGCAARSRGLPHSPVEASQCRAGQWVTGWDGHATWSSDGHVAFNRNGRNGSEWVVAAPPDYHSDISQIAQVRWSRFVTDRELALVTQQTKGNANRYFFQMLTIPGGTVTTRIDLGLNFTDVLELNTEELVVLENGDLQSGGHRSAILAHSLHGAPARILDLGAALGDSENFFFLEHARDGFAVLSRVKAAATSQATELPDVALYRVDLRQWRAYALKFESPASSAMALGFSGLFATTPRPGAPVWLFDLRTGRQVHRLEQPVASADPVKWSDGSACLGFDPSGKLLAVAGYQQPIRWYDVRSGRLVASSVEPVRYDEGSFFGCNIAFTPDHQLIVQDDGAGGLAAWDLLSRAKRYELEFSERSPLTDRSNSGSEHEVANGSRETYTEAVVSPTARHLVVFLHPNLHQQSSEDSCTLVDLQTGTYAKFAIGSGPAAFSQDGRLLIAGGIVWDIETQKRLGELKTFKSSCKQKP